MKSKVLGIVGLIVLIAATVVGMVIITIDQCSIYAPSQDNIRFSDVDSAGNKYAYFCSSSNEGLIKLSNKNKLIASVTDSDLDLYSGQKVIDLACSTHNVFVLTKTGSGANLYTYDEELTLKNRRDISAPDGAYFGKIRAEGEIVYIPQFTNNGTVVSVLKAVGKEESLLSVYTADAPDKVHFLNGFYTGTKFESLYSNGVRTNGYSTLDEREPVVPESVGIMGVSMGFPTVARNVIIMALIIFIIAFFFRTVILKRSYAWLRIYSFMIVVTLSMLVVIVIVGDRISSSRLADRVSQMDFVLDTYASHIKGYDGSVGTGIYDEAYTALKNDENSCSVVYDTVVVIQNNDRAQVALSGVYSYGDWLADRWGEEVDEVMQKSLLRNSLTSGEVTLNSVRYAVVIKPINSSSSAQLYIAALVKCADLEAEESSTMWAYTIAMILVWAVGLVLISYVNLSASAELRHISDTLVRVSNNAQREVIKPSSGCRDYEKLWNCAVELSKNLGRNVYDKNQMHDSLARFAPTNIERLLGKENITEIRHGDRGTVTGSVALIKMSRPFVKSREEYLDIMNNNMGIVAKYREQFGGVLLADSLTLCSTTVLFPETGSDLLMFGIRTADALGRSSDSTRQKSLIFMHNTNYMYGITGSSDQNLPIVYSNELDALSKYIDELTGMGLKFVVTEPMIAGYKGEILTRYIGFLELKDCATNMKIYEVLDACNISERKRKKDTLDSFNKALELYYKNDFYLARNIFTEVIKDCPEDLVARWYLFKCEGMLDNMFFDTFSYGFLTE